MQPSFVGSRPMKRKVFFSDGDPFLAAFWMIELGFEVPREIGAGEQFSRAVQGLPNRLQRPVDFGSGGPPRGRFGEGFGIGSEIVSGQRERCERFVDHADVGLFFQRAADPFCVSDGAPRCVEPEAVLEKFPPEKHRATHCAEVDDPGMGGGGTNDPAIGERLALRIDHDGISKNDVGFRVVPKFVGHPFQCAGEILFVAIQVG